MSHNSFLIHGVKIKIEKSFLASSGDLSIIFDVESNISLFCILKKKTHQPQIKLITSVGNFFNRSKLKIDSYNFILQKLINSIFNSALSNLSIAATILMIYKTFHKYDVQLLLIVSIILNLSDVPFQYFIVPLKFSYINNLLFTTPSYVNNKISNASILFIFSNSKIIFLKGIMKKSYELLLHKIFHISYREYLFYRKNIVYTYYKNDQSIMYCNLLYIKFTIILNKIFRVYFTECLICYNLCMINLKIKDIYVKLFILLKNKISSSQHFFDKLFFIFVKKMLRRGYCYSISKKYSKKLYKINNNNIELFLLSKKVLNHSIYTYMKNVRDKLIFKKDRNKIFFSLFIINNKVFNIIVNSRIYKVTKNLFMHFRAIFLLGIWCKKHFLFVVELVLEKGTLKKISHLASRKYLIANTYSECFGYLYALTYFYMVSKGINILFLINILKFYVINGVDNVITKDRISYSANFLFLQRRIKKGEIISDFFLISYRKNNLCTKLQKHQDGKQVKKNISIKKYFYPLVIITLCIFVKINIYRCTDTSKYNHIKLDKKNRIKFLL